MHRTIGGRCLTAAVIAAMLFSAAAVGRGAERQAGGQRPDPAWPPKLYAFCVDMPAVKDPSVAEQAKLLRELGFDGVGYPLWLDERLEKNLQVLDEAGLAIYLMHAAVNVNPDKPPYDPRLPAAIRQLRGRPAVVSVLLTGLAPGDPSGMEQARRVLRELGDVAAEAGLRISIYNHVNNWTESVLFALEVAEETDHPSVGVNFNLCHWLKVDGDKDYRPVLEGHAAKIFAVTINGAQLGAETWTDGLIQPLDRGDFDNRRLLETLRRIGYGGPVGLMCYAVPGPAREHLQRSMDVWRSWQRD